MIVVEARDNVLGGGCEHQRLCLRILRRACQGMFHDRLVSPEGRIVPGFGFSWTMVLVSRTGFCKRSFSTSAFCARKNGCGLSSLLDLRGWVREW